MTDDQLREIEARAAEATPGPWKNCGAGIGGCICGLVWTIPLDTVAAQARKDGVLDCKGHWLGRDDVLETDFKADAAFVAHAREDVPALVAEVRVLLDERDRLAAEVARLRKGPAGWEEDHQRRALEAAGIPEFSCWGCDAIQHVAEALVASRAERGRLDAENIASAEAITTWQERHDRLAAEVARLEAEQEGRWRDIERLEAALKEVAVAPQTVCAYGHHPSCDCGGDKVRAALAAWDRAAAGEGGER